MEYIAGSCDVAVIGAGHAGIDAALAAARRMDPPPDYNPGHLAAARPGGTKHPVCRPDRSSKNQRPL